MALYKRDGSKFYWTKFTFQGKLVQQSTKCSSKAKAQVFEDALKTQLNFGRIGIEDVGSRNEDVLFKDACAQFFDDLDDVKDSTRARYQTAAKPLLAFFGDMPVDKIDQELVIRYRKDRRDQKVKAPARKLRKDKKATTNKAIKPATINRECTLLAMVFRYLIIVKKLKLTIPTIGLKQLNEDNITDRLVTKRELARYLRHAGQTLRDVARLMYYTGMRPGEVLALTVSDIEFYPGGGPVAGVITVQHGKTKSARRENSFDRHVGHILQRRCRNAHHGLLFAGGRNGKGSVPMVKVNNAHHKALSLSKVKPFRLYDLRHMFATDSLASGMDLETMRNVAGWASLAMLKRYVKPTIEHKARAMQKLQEYRNGNNANVVPFKRQAA